MLDIGHELLLFLGSTCPGAQALRVHQHTFCSHLKRRFSAKFRPKYAYKCVFFEKKTLIAAVSLFPQTLALLLSPTITTLLSLFLALNAFCYYRKRIPYLFKKLSCVNLYIRP